MTLSKKLSLTLFCTMLIGTQAVFAPTNKADLKAAVGSCTYAGTCTGGCLGETANGSCPIFADSDATTGNPYGLIGSWDTSQVTDMEAMFSNAIAFNQPLDWVTSQVTTMGSMFYDARAFNQPLTFDTSNVTTMLQMFTGATSFNQSLTFTDTSSVTTMAFMFNGATSFNQPLTFNTSQVTNMGYMFSNANAFNQPLTFDWSKVTNMGSMFQGAFNCVFCDIGLKCPAGKLRVSDGAECTVPVPACTAGKLTCAELKAEYQSSS